MLRNVEELSSGIYKIDNFISKGSCDFLINNLSLDLQKTPDMHISGTLGSKNTKYLELIGNYNSYENYNVSIDLFNSIALSLADVISNVFNQQHMLKQTFYSVMETGGENEVHTDNYEESNKKDKSGLLYLNDEFTGGELVFPEQNITVYPKPGTLIFFEGTIEKPHGVNKVLSGKRHNIITFFEPR